MLGSRDIAMWPLLWRPLWRTEQQELVILGVWYCPLSQHVLISLETVCFKSFYNSDVISLKSGQWLADSPVVFFIMLVFAICHEKKTTNANTKSWRINLSWVRRSLVSGNRRECTGESHTFWPLKTHFQCQFKQYITIESLVFNTVKTNCPVYERIFPSPW